MRSVLDRFADTSGDYQPSIREHETLGLLDYTHLPLQVVRQIAPDDFEKIRSYRAFALVRDPEARFVSALSQRLKMYGTREIAQIDAAEVDQRAREVVKALQEPETAHRPEFIHFARQSDFILFEGQQIVDTVYTTAEVGTMIAEIEQITGDTLGHVGNDNPTMVFRHDALGRLALVGKGLSQRLLGPNATATFRNWARKLLMQPLRNSSQRFTLSDDVRNFVKTFYAEDFALYAKASEALDTRKRSV